MKNTDSITKLDKNIINMRSTLNTELLATLLKEKRGSKGLRDTANEIGDVSYTTLSRIELGKIPDVDTFIKLCKWLKVSTDTFITDKKRTIMKTTEFKETPFKESNELIDKFVMENNLDAMHLQFYMEEKYNIPLPDDGFISEILEKDINE